MSSALRMRPFNQGERRGPGRLRWLALAGVLALTVAGCGGPVWNNPYPASDAGENVLYSSFAERPKHMDPARSYSSDEYAFIAQVYEPPLQYHLFKRPYELVPLAAEQVPQPRFLDNQGNLLPDDASAERIAFSEYEVRIRPGMRYQPHPALARDSHGEPLYHRLAPETIARVNTLADFPETGTREVLAEDFVNQIKRLASPRSHSPIASLMSEYIVGFESLAQALEAEDARLRETRGEERPYPDLRGFILEGARVLDDHRYVIRLKGKYPQFVYWLAMSFFAPMPWEADAFYGQPGMAARNVTLDWFPLGSGPFMLSENNPNLRMVLSRNPNFHGEAYPADGTEADRAAGLLADAGRPLPLIDRAVYSLEKESIPRWNKFLQGYYDASGIASDSFDQAVEMDARGEPRLTGFMQERGIRLVTAVETSSMYLGFNWLDPVVGGNSESARKLRQAIAIAMDFEEYISIFANGRAIAAQGPLPPGIFGYREGPEGINRSIYDATPHGPRRRPIEEARRLMAEAGYPEGREQASGRQLNLYYDVTASGPDDKARLSWMVKQFAKLGVVLVIRATDYNRFQEKMRKGTVQIYMWGWNADYPDPENFLFLLAGSNGKVEHGGENASNYANPEFDALFERMKDLPNGPERQQVIDRMLEIVRHDAPWAGGYHPKSYSLYHQWYGNVTPNLMANNTLKYRRIDPQGRDALRQAWNPPILWPLWLAGVLILTAVVPAVVAYRRRERSQAR